jgi:hypothetical protein
MTELELTAAIDASTPTHSAGWCNGLAGGAVAALIGARALGSSRLAAMAVRYVRAAMSELPLDTDGLCHGSAGVLVIGAAVARCIDDGDLTAEVMRVADTHWADHATREWRLDPGLVADQSWLTGVAGATWAAMAVRVRPIVNPLCPPDAVLADHGYGR